MKVLVADDNAGSRQLAKDILASIGLDVLLTQDGPSTLASAQLHLPDLLVLDIDMPGMNGFDVCALLKANAQTAHIPVLMLTAQSDVDQRVRGLEAGADDYLSKPYSPRELIARVETRLRAKFESDEMRQMQHLIRSTFERFVHPSVVEQLLHDPTQVKLGGKLQEVTVMFADMEGFTSMSEHVDPEQVLTLINRYHDLIVGLIQQHSGMIDKFLGDGLMALFNTPLPLADHTRHAVESALAIRAVLAEFHAELDPQQRMGINFGIHTGLAVVGNVGATQIMDYTAVGDTVNVAARLQGLARGSQILVSAAVYQQVEPWVTARAMGQVQVKNRQEAVMTYEILGLHE
jgi:class 3 adenylate cyclase